MAHNGIIVLLVSIAICVCLTATATENKGKPVGVDREAWNTTIRQLERHGEAAFRVGPRLVALHPDVGLEILQDNWKVLGLEVKRGFLKAFAFCRHPRVLEALHLGATDEFDRP